MRLLWNFTNDNTKRDIFNNEKCPFEFLLLRGLRDDPGLPIYRAEDHQDFPFR
jgi:hypothetical protein